MRLSETPDSQALLGGASIRRGAWSCVEFFESRLCLAAGEMIGAEGGMYSGTKSPWVLRGDQMYVPIIIWVRQSENSAPWHLWALSLARFVDGTVMSFSVDMTTE